jgi:medium-chain acyl-[acyl-carrier-protein] hydrolase
LRLFCFPPAGAGASLFSTWARELPAGVEVCSVQLPGREDRRAEAPLRRLPAAMSDVCADLRPFWDQPYVLFGHSMGALLAFEAARALRAVGDPAPQQLLCSACRSPEAVRTETSVYRLPDAEFIRHLRVLGGIPEPVLRDPEMMELFLPILRADFELLQTYEFRSQPPLRCPITVFGGTQDTEAPPHILDAWRHHTTGPFDRIEFASGHFFIQTERSTFLRRLSEILERLMDTMAG